MAAILASLAGLMAWAPLASATTYRVRTQSRAMAMQFERADGRLLAPRHLAQAVQLWAWDLAQTPATPLDAHLSLRYFTDLALDPELRRLPGWQRQWNHVSLEQAWVQWQPRTAVALRLGRQWHSGALGTRDFDGARLWLRGPGRRFIAEMAFYGGVALEGPRAWWAPEIWDIPGATDVWQAAPSQARALFGAQAGLGGQGPLRLQAAFERRAQAFAPPTSPTYIAEERAALSATLTPWATLQLDGHASYHTLLGAVDRARLELGYHPGAARLAGGWQRQQAWFDSASIFNLFGATPNDALYARASWQGAPGGLGHWELRPWLRQYDRGASHATPERFRRVLGLALSHRRELRLGASPLQWHTDAQVQADAHGAFLGTAPGEPWGSERQGALHTALSGAALLGPNWRWRAELMALGLWPDSPGLALPSTHAGTLGARLALDFSVGELGRASVWGEQGWGEGLVETSRLGATFVLEARP